MTSTELERAERWMQQKWYDLVTAEQEGASPQALEQMYYIYILAVEEYNRCSTCSPLCGSEALQSQQQGQLIPVAPPGKRRAISPSATNSPREHKKRAS